jgi:hypothetical protein
VHDWRGKSPNEILTNCPLDRSSWHFFQARSWLDYATRENAPSAIYYAAFELRYGIEYLLFELLVFASESLSLREYEQAIGDPKQMKTMLASPARNYAKLAEFSKVVVSVDSHTPPVLIWNLNDLFRYWGMASEFLHFVGPHSVTYFRTDWTVKAIAKLDSVLTRLWSAITTTVGIALIRPSNMEPEVRQAWTEFKSGTLDKDDLIRRLKIMQPGLQARRGKTGWRFRGCRVIAVRTD